MKRPSATEQAAQHVDDYAKGIFREAFIRVEKLRHGEGCGCINCKKQAIREVNSISTFLAGDQEDLPQYYLDADGGIDLR